MVLVAENIDIEFKNGFNPKFSEVRMVPFSGSTFFSSIPDTRTVDIGFYSTFDLHDSPQLINELVFEAANESYPIPDSKTITTFLRTYEKINKLGISVKSSTPIEEGGLSLDVSLKSKYLHITIYNGESNLSIYIEETGKIPSVFDLPIDLALGKIESFIA